MKVFTVARAAKVYAYSKPVSMSCSFPALEKLVAQKMRKHPDSGDLFLFFNKKMNYVKVLFWAKDGFCIFAKKLPKGLFDAESIVNSMTLSELESFVNEIYINRTKVRHLKRAA